MDDSTKTEFTQKVIQVIQHLQTEENEWVNFARIGAPLTAADVQYKQLGFPKLRPFLNEFSEILEFKDECVEGKLPVSYVRLRTAYSADKIESPEIKSSAQEMSSQYSEPVLLERLPTNDSWLFKWASIPAVKMQSLSKLALPEKWYYGETEPETDEKYHILKNYLAYTFKKLVNEKNVIIENNPEENVEYAAFNTGLVDHKYEYIYALFKQDLRYKRYYWYLVDFVVAGEDAGKTLVGLFNPLPPKADYFQNKIENMLYDSSTGALSCDYVHILTERTNRLPVEFFNDNCPNGFTCINGVNIEDVYSKKDFDEDKKNYFRTFGEKIKNDGRVLNRLKNRLQDSVDLALKRVEWNYKTAIPMYFPTRNTMSLLLPLALVDEARVDLALVVERQPSGAYQGETVLPLDWAYSNSRLVTRPDSDWLRTDIIKLDDDEVIE